MLVGCDCHCGNVPDISLFPSNDSASIITPPFLCGACYNFPVRWKVTINHDWFIWAGDLDPTINECPFATSNFQYTLRQVGSGGDSCAKWDSDERAQNLSTLPCPPDEPIYAICGPHNPTPRVQLTAVDLVDRTLLTLLFQWVVPLDGNSCDLYATGFSWRFQVFKKNQSPTNEGTPISCVRTFVLAYYESFPDGGPPFALSLDNAWQTILIEPA